MSATTAARFKLIFFTPKKHTHEILQSLFQRHPQTVGKIGNYEQCAFVTPGTGQNFLFDDPDGVVLTNRMFRTLGQFKPCLEAKPAIGKAGSLEYVEEDRVEIVVNDEGGGAALKQAVNSLKEVHPYEEVAYDVYKLELL